MAVTPLGNSNFINQNAPVVSQVHANQQARFDMQALLAAELATQQNEEIQEVRPMEESYKLDPEKRARAPEKRARGWRIWTWRAKRKGDEELNLDDGGIDDDVADEPHVLDIKI